MYSDSAQNSRKRRFVFAAFLLLAALTVSVRFTGALFTDTEAVTNNTFTVGSVDIAVAPASALFNVPAMAPGDVEVAELDVDNSGSMQLRYAVASVTTENTLAAGLTLTIKSGVSTCTESGFDTDGSQLYSGVLGTTGGTPLIGDASSGADTGDRTLNAGGGESLCFRVSLPLNASDTLQDLSTTATFTFYAEQTSNNP